MDARVPGVTDCMVIFVTAVTVYVTAKHLCIA